MSWDELGLVGTSWDELGPVGTSWDKLGQVGMSWQLKKLQNFDIKKTSPEERRKKKNIGYRVASNERRPTNKREMILLLLRNLAVVQLQFPQNQVQK